ncbi:MAG: hypothetical protein ACK5H2_05965 [Beutenbergiaceae bacterium]
MLLLTAGFVGVRALVGLVPSEGDTAARSPAIAAIPRVPEERSGEPTEFDLANPVDCRPGTLAVTVALPTASVAAGSGISVPINVHNTGQLPCLLDLGGDNLVLTIYSGEDLVWTSQHCGGAGDERRLLLAIGAVDATTVDWDGTRSMVGCLADQPVAAAGTYRVVAQILTDPTDGADPVLVAQTEQVFTVV